MSGEEAHDSEATAVEPTVSVKNSNSVHRESKDSPARDIESQILGAMRSRVSYLSEKADSFTFESVRRLLEEDLGLDKYALDVHKRFIKQHLVNCLEVAGDDNASENSQEAEKKDDAPDKEAAQSPKRLKSKRDVKEDEAEVEEKMEDSPVMGLLTSEETTKPEAKEAEDEGKKEVLESGVKKALRKRASYIKANSDQITMALLRRLLEKDLKLEKYTLDPYKTFINEQLDEVLETLEASERVTEAKGRNLKKISGTKPPKKLRSDENFDSSDSEDDKEEEEMKIKKKTGPERKIQKSDEPKKRKHEKETKVSAKKRAKPSETDSRNDSDAADSEIVSDDGHSQSSSEKPVKKKEATASVYGKRAEHLKSVIKSCGMSVPPSIYRRVKQTPEEKREANLIKELEQVLAKEGLSSNPSEKEIKDVRKRKERARELEGIDMSNIVSSSRRRSTTSFAPPPKPKIPDETDSDESEDSAKDGDDDNEQEQEEEDGDNEEGDEESPSEGEEDDSEESE